MEIGNFSDNSLRFIDITKLAHNLGMQVAQALPAFHAFTGCDFSPSFVGKGKTRPLNNLLKYADCQIAFARLGTEKPDENMIKGIESFAYKLYGNKTSNSINDVLIQNFLKAVKSKKNADMLAAVKGCDGSSLPPCYRILYNHILRTEYIATMWKNNKDLPPHSNHGWLLKDNTYVVNWSDGDQYPSDVEINGSNEEQNDEENEKDLEQYESGEDESAVDEDENNIEDFVQLF